LKSIFKKSPAHRASRTITAEFSSIESTQYARFSTPANVHFWPKSACRDRQHPTLSGRSSKSERRRSTHVLDDQSSSSHACRWANYSQSLIGESKVCSSQ
jgi:hypothetical protein